MHDWSMWWRRYLKQGRGKESSTRFLTTIYIISTSATPADEANSSIKEQSSCHHFATFEYYKDYLWKLKPYVMEVLIF